MRCVPVCLALLLVLPLRAQDDPEWTTPIAPFRIADNLYYVGSKDLAAYLVTTPAGNILINQNLPSSPALLRASVERLGLRWQDTRILLNSQAHFDHTGGTAEIARQTHAQVMVMEGDSGVVESGGENDFITNRANVRTYPPAHVDRVLHDHDTVSLGGVTLTALRTPGHTRGCTTWTLRAHVPGDPPTRTRLIVIVGGVSFWSDYHFTATPAHPASYPGIADDFRHTFAVLEALPAEIFLGAHGGYFGLQAKLLRYPTEGPRVFLDPTGYHAFIAQYRAAFEKALASESTSSQ